REVTEQSACNQAKHLWDNATPASDQHPYLVKKGIKSHGLREHKGLLVVPVRNNDGLQSLQFIGSNGDKRFLSGGKVKGGYFSIGTAKDKLLCLCEGYATGASIFAATGYAVAIAFNAGNLSAIAKLLRHKFPEHQLIICADDDSWTDGNPGLQKARETALRVGGLLAIPNFGENCTPGLSDFNDLHQHCGIETVRQIINTTIKGYASLKLICATDLKPESIHWLWQDWLACGKLHIIAGAPGTGKTTIGLNLAAIITRGAQWPDDARCDSPGNILIWSGEDDPRDTLLPRLLAHGADPKRIYFVSDMIENNTPRAFDPARDMPKLYERALPIGEIRLIIIDPIVNVVSGDSHKNGEVRRALQPLVELGEKLNAVILGISHFSKGTTGLDPLERVTGSIAFGALARMVLATAKMTEPDGQLKRLLVRAKSNHGPDGGGFNYQIEQIELENYPGIFASQVIWGAPVDGTARELLRDPNDFSTPEKCSSLSEAIDFLKALLAEGAMLKKEITQKAMEAGIKSMTLRRAKASLRIVALHEGFGKGSVWKWRLPSEELKKPNVVRLQRVSEIAQE
ncbi:MAG TPA: AAA family ATPase, partial [Gammaproteobacteria bacterium]|nr:AAA family ATPase [Gammaproteobacteria bacterium]